MQSLLSSYVNGSHDECFEALTIFKSVFGHLIDPNISSIQCNLISLEIDRNGIKYTTDQSYGEFLLSNIEDSNKLLGEQDSTILEACDSIYAEQLSLFNYINYSGYDACQPHEVRGHLYEVVKCFPPVLVEHLYLFGNNDLAYKMYRSHFVQEAKKQISRESTPLNIDTRFRSLLDKTILLARNSSYEVLKKLVRQIKKHLKLQQTLHQIQDLFDKYQWNGEPEHQWDIIGKSLTEGGLLQEEFISTYEEFLSELCVESFLNLSVDEKDALYFKNLNFQYFNYELFDGDLSTFVLIEDVIEDIVEVIKHEAIKDWRSKNTKMYKLDEIDTRNILENDRVY